MWTARSERQEYSTWRGSCVVSGNYQHSVICSRHWRLHTPHHIWLAEFFFHPVWERPDLHHWQGHGAWDVKFSQCTVFYWDYWKSVEGVKFTCSFPERIRQKKCCVLAGSAVVEEGKVRCMNWGRESWANNTSFSNFMWIEDTASRSTERCDDAKNLEPNQTCVKLAAIVEQQGWGCLPLLCWLSLILVRGSNCEPISAWQS